MELRGKILRKETEIKSQSAMRAIRYGDIPPVHAATAAQVAIRYACN